MPRYYVTYSFEAEFEAENEEMVDIYAVEAIEMDINQGPLDVKLVIDEAEEGDDAPTTA